MEPLAKKNIRHINYPYQETVQKRQTIFNTQKRTIF